MRSAHDEKLICNMVGMVRLERTSLPFQGSAKTDSATFPWRLRLVMEPVPGIEPRSARYECAALPLCYAGMAASAGLEPATLALTGRCATIAPRGNVRAAGQDRTDLVRLKRSVPLHFGISGMVSRTRFERVMVRAARFERARCYASASRTDGSTENSPTRAYGPQGAT